MAGTITITGNIISPSGEKRGAITSDEGVFYAGLGIAEDKE